ncbi:MAG: hypothetical protein US31_C0030G0007 [Berkelbacteria bacterium GW2011_GWA1_36_9]|uniref:Uncharacterized protein n=1 Tax=Berkelbacteria bacterium GW2011_GWA1_36_9 TaxID=1618331 RepID=A0A0G0FBF6_9BACT|nr:MAG: hypothetical protein US31_C0030G0007 [Berkelbacteria bacterium GW2011_GWA1_36_9]
MRLRKIGAIGILSLCSRISNNLSTEVSKSSDFRHSSFVAGDNSLEGICRPPILGLPSNGKSAMIIHKNREVIYVDRSSIKKLYSLEEGESFIGLDYYPCGFVMFTNKGAHYFTQR